MIDSGSPYIRYPNDAFGLRRFRAGDSQSARVLCIPYAGGQSLAFRPLAEHLPTSWGVWAIDPPGHGWCPGMPLSSVDQMVDAYLGHLPLALVEGVVLLGHSLGGCVAFAMAQRLLAQGRRPAAVVLSGTRPPHRRRDYQSFLEMDDTTLLQALIQIGGVPAEWADEPEVFDHFKGALRADFQAFEGFDVDQPLEGLPILAVGGMQDVVCRPEHVFEWSRFCPRCRIDFVAGGHMFLQTHPELMARRIVTALGERVQRTGR